MAAPVLQFKRGLIANLPALKAGEPGFTTDGFDLFVGLDNNSANNKFFGSHRYWTKETSSTGSSVKVVEGTTNGTNSIALKSPDNLASDLTYVLPGTQGAVSSVLTNDGSGNLSWSSGSLNPVFTGIATFNTSQVNINSTLSVTGVTTFSNTTDSTSTTTGAVIVSGGVGIAKNLRVGQELNVTGGANISGVSTFTGITTVTGNTLFATQFSNTGVTTHLNTTDSTSTTTGAVIVSGGVGIAKNLRVGQELNVTGGSVVAGISSVTNATDNTLGTTNTGSVQISGGAAITKNLTVGAAATIIGNFFVGGSSEFVGVVTFRGGTINIGDANTDNVVFTADVNSDIIPNTDAAFDFGSSAQQWRNIFSKGTASFASLTASGVSSVTNTTDATSTSTGAFRVSGGAGIAKNLFVGQELDVNNGLNVTAGVSTFAGITTVTGTTLFATQFSNTGITSITNTTDATSTSTGAFRVSGGAAVAKNLFVGQELDVNNGLNVTAGVSTFAGITTVTGPTLFTKQLNVSGVSTFGSSLTVSTLTSGRVVTAGTNGVLQDSANLTFGNGGLTVGANGINVTGVSTFSTDLRIGGNAILGGNTIKASDGTTAITVSNTTGNVGISSDLTVTGKLFVLGTTTEINTETLKVEDSLIEVGLVNSGGSLVPPSSDLNIDVGVIFHYFTSTAKKSAVFWDDSASRIVLASDVSETSSVMTISSYAAVEMGELWFNNSCSGGSSQVIACSGSNLVLQNIVVDGGSF